MIQAVVATGLRLARAPHAWWFGAVFAIGYAWSREKTEYEFALKAAAHGHSVGPYWYRGFISFEWPLSSQFEFYAPAIAVLAIAWMMERRRGRA